MSKNNRLTPEKRGFIRELIQMYDVKTARDIHEALKDLLDLNTNCSEPQAQRIIAF